MKKTLKMLTILSMSFFILGFTRTIGADTLIASFLGDSVTYGDTLPSQEYAYPSVFGELSQMKINNYGVCATTLANNSPRSMIERYKEIDKQSNLIVVAGGSNDFGFNTPIGEVGSTDVTTFHGALNVLMTNLKNEYPGATIVFMTPIKRGDFQYHNILGYYLEDYRDAIVEEAGIHGIRVVDLLSEPSLDFTANWQITLPDGLHPNAESQRKIGEYLYMQLSS